MSRKLMMPISIIIAVILVCVVWNGTHKLVVYDNIKRAGDAYEPIEIINGDYKLHTIKTTDDFGTYVHFEVCDVKTDELKFVSKDEWEAYDLKSIDFDKNSNDIRVESGEKGVVLYRYHDGTWSVSTIN